MGKHGKHRYCRCGTRLASDNSGTACASCQKQARATLAQPPTVPPEFWQTDQMQDAVESWHIGRVIQAYRTHPWHPRPLSQGTVAAWIGLTQTQLSRIENGPPTQDLTKLIQWARVLRIPARLLWFKLPTDPAAVEPTPAATPQPVSSPDTGDAVKRRELLRAMSLAGSLLALPSSSELDVDRLTTVTRGATMGAATLTEYDRLNTHLWQAFAQSQSKRDVMPLVRHQLDVLTGHLQRSQPPSTHQQLCRLAGDLFQLCGEILFDADCYSEAAHSYVLAASASKEAHAPDLWACAMTRHAFIGVYERRFDQAVPLLEGAARVARRGDTALPTRHWVAAVQAQTFAGLHDAVQCQRAMERAALVNDVGAPPKTGWLRFTGSRLAEEQGSCLIELDRPELAEPSLLEAIRRPLSARRRGGVLADLAAVGAQRHDAEQTVLYGSAAVDAARQTSSAGYVGRKLSLLQPRLKPMLADRHVRHLDRQITKMTTNWPTNEENTHV